MFCKNLKNIYLNLKKNNLYEAKYCADNLLRYVNTIQSGGALPPEVKRELDTLGLDMSKIIDVLTFLLDYISKIKFGDVSQIKSTLESMNKTLKQRLEGQEKD